MALTSITKITVQTNATSARFPVIASPSAKQSPACLIYLFFQLGTKAFQFITFLSQQKIASFLAMTVVYCFLGFLADAFYTFHKTMNSSSDIIPAYSIAYFKNYSRTVCGHFLKNLYLSNIEQYLFKLL